MIRGKTLRNQGFSHFLAFITGKISVICWRLAVKNAPRTHKKGVSYTIKGMSYMIEEEISH
jgi:hypothetical protein